MPTIEYEIFGRGALEDANATLHSAIKTVVGDLWLKNTGDTDETVTIALNRAVGGALDEISLLLKAGWHADVSGIILTIGDAIEAFSTSADAVNWELTGQGITP